MKAQGSSYLLRQGIEDRLHSRSVVAQVLELVAMLLHKREAVHLADAHIICNSLVPSLVVLEVLLCCEQRGGRVIHILRLIIQVLLFLRLHWKYTHQQDAQAYVSEKFHSQK